MYYNTLLSAPRLYLLRVVVIERIVQFVLGTEFENYSLREGCLGLVAHPLTKNSRLPFSLL